MRNVMNRISKRLVECVAIFALLLISGTVYGGALDDDLAEQWETREIPAFTGEPVFSPAQRFELALNIGVIPTDDYFNYIPLSLDVQYHFTEMWGLGLRGTLLMLHTDTVLSEFMASHQDSIDPSFLSDEQRGDVSVMASFHPVYGKSSIGTYNPGRFDWGIFAGMGVVISESSNADRTQREIQAHIEGVLGTDFQVFFLDWLALRLEASMRFYHAPTQWVIPCTLSAGVSFYLPAL